MSIHKLTAGSGYDYLTRQVAALDATEKGHTGLASYYTERGETPGVWIGSGLDGIDGLNPGDPVTAEQMRALFGCGLHPLAELRQQQLEGPNLATRDYQDAARLGAPFKILDGDVSPFHLEVTRRFAALNAAAGVPAGNPLPAADRARVRTEVAREFFLAEHGREPMDARELAGQIAKDSRPRTQTVAGYDLTFSPVKSVSTLWAVADPAVAAVIERAHQAAVKDALTFIEKHALFTRTGAQGIRQVNVRGLVAAAFTHRDSRAGDPDLHTHVAVANKIQTLDGCWLSIDGRVLFKANVAASETYNTALEQHLRDNLGVRFAERPGTDPAKRPIREIVGVDPRLNQRWSTRRAHVEARRGELAIQFQHDHGRPPTPVEALHLAQQATLETRNAKHEPRSLAEQRATWHDEAAAVLGSSEAVASMVRTALTPLVETATIADTRWVPQTASHVLAVMEESRSTWQMWHVRAEAQRQVRTIDLPAEQAAALVDLLIDEVLDRRSIALAARDHIEEPETLRRVDGSSVYTVAGAALYTSQRILDAEQRLLTAAGRRGDASVEQTAGLIDRAIDQWEATYGRSTVKNTIAALVLVLDEAVRDGLLLRNPAKDRARRRIVGRSALPMASRESPRDFALPDVRTLSRLVEEAVHRGGHPAWGDCVTILATTALRISEVAGLQVGDIDLPHGLLTVRRQTYPGRGGLVTKETKGRRRRSVPIIEPLRPTLERLTTGRARNARLLVGPRGVVITTATLRDATGWDELVDDLGLAGLVRHGLRHTALTWMADAGVELHLLQRVAGHQDAAVTSRYLHPDHQAVLDVGVAYSRWWARSGPNSSALRLVEDGPEAG